MEWLNAFLIISIPLFVVTDGWWPFMPIAFLIKVFFDTFTVVLWLLDKPIYAAQRLYMLAGYRIFGLARFKVALEEDTARLAVNKEERTAQVDILRAGLGFAFIALSVWIWGVVVFVVFGVVFALTLARICLSSRQFFLLCVLLFFAVIWALIY